jgi:hypothetical protein
MRCLEESQMGHPAASENRQLASPPKASRDSGGNPRTLRLPAHRGQAGPLISPGNRPSRRLRDVDLLLHFTVLGEKVANRSWKSGPHVHKSRQRLRFPLPLEIKNRRDAINQEAELRSTSVRLSMPPPQPRPANSKGPRTTAVGAAHTLKPSSESFQQLKEPDRHLKLSSRSKVWQLLLPVPVLSRPGRTGKNPESPLLFRSPGQRRLNQTRLCLPVIFPSPFASRWPPPEHRHSSGIVVPLQSLSASPWIFAGGRPFPGSL